MVELKKLFILLSFVDYAELYARRCSLYARRCSLYVRRCSSVQETAKVFFEALVMLKRKYVLKHNWCILCNSEVWSSSLGSQMFILLCSLCDFLEPRTSYLE